jgi:ElaA protein
MKWVLKPFGELSGTEVFEMLSLRCRVFIVEQNCPYQDADYKDRQSIHLLAMQEDECMACLRLVPPGVSYAEWSIGRVVTDARLRHTGLGKELMRRGMHELAANKGNPAIRISAQTYLLRFYGSFGFQFTGKEYLEDDIPHSEMIFIPTPSLYQPL